MASNTGTIPPVRPMSWLAVVRFADDTVERHFASHVRDCRPIPVQEFLEHVLPTFYNVDEGVSDELPPGIEGITYPKNRRGNPEIVLSSAVYENLCQDQPRARFTATHECGHGIMHIRQVGTQLVDGTHPVLYRRDQLPAYLSPEWQANVFASTFLMPTKALMAIGKNRRIDDALVAKTFQVSVEAASIRLSDMRRRGVLR